MKIPKFVNKKMVIFVVLFVAFIYFSGIFHYMREGLTPGTQIIKGIDCSGCSKSLTGPKCNAKCPKLKYKNFISTYNGKDTKLKLKPPNTLTKQPLNK